MTMFLAGALKYAKGGIPVFPIASGKKAPPLYAWATEATTDESIIRGWWTKHPTANIGIPTGVRSGLLVVDVDVKNGHDGLGSLEKLQRLKGGLATVRSKTPSGGGFICGSRSVNPLVGI